MTKSVPPKKNSKRILGLYLLFGGGLVALAVAALSFGSVRLSFAQLVESLGEPQSTAGIIVMGLRLPRMLGAGLAGGALAAAGLLLQAVTGNELCAPNVIGVNAGAGFAVIGLLCLAPQLWRWLPLGAFVGALLTTALVMGLALSGGGHSGGSSIVLAGVAVSSIFNAGVSFLSLRFPDVLSSYTAFSVGGFAWVTLDELKLPVLMIGLSLLGAQALSPKLNLLCLGDEIAATLGIGVKSLRRLALLLAACLCGAAVSFAGLLGFVGLVVPHIVKRLAGSDLRVTLGLSVLFGAGLVILSDLIGRVAFAPTELPAGILMALLGAPFFLYLLMKRRRRDGEL